MSSLLPAFSPVRSQASPAYRLLRLPWPRHWIFRLPLTAYCRLPTSLSQPQPDTRHLTPGT
jgi:hypothetical protein